MRDRHEQEKGADAQRATRTAAREVHCNAHLRQRRGPVSWQSWHFLLSKPCASTSCWFARCWTSGACCCRGRGPAPPGRRAEEGGGTRSSRGGGARGPRRRRGGAACLRRDNVVTGLPRRTMRKRGGSRRNSTGTHESDSIRPRSRRRHRASDQSSCRSRPHFDRRVHTGRKLPAARLHLSRHYGASI